MTFVWAPNRTVDFQGQFMFSPLPAIRVSLHVWFYGAEDFFHRSDNQDYMGSWPARDQYDPEGMMPAKRTEFDQWYDTVREKHFICVMK